MCLFVCVFSRLCVHVVGCWFVCVSVYRFGGVVWFVRSLNCLHVGVFDCRCIRLLVNSFGRVLVWFGCVIDLFVLLGCASVGLFVCWFVSVLV